MNFLKMVVFCVIFTCSTAVLGFTIPDIPDINITKTKTSILIKRSSLIELLQYANTLSELTNNEKECIKESDSAYYQLDFITDLMPPPFKPEVPEEEKLELPIPEFDKLIDYILYLRLHLKPKKIYCSDV